MTQLLGKLSIRLIKIGRNPAKKTIPIYFCRSHTSVDAAAKKILDLKKVKHQNTDWEVEGVSGGGERVRLVSTTITQLADSSNSGESGSSANSGARPNTGARPAPGESAADFANRATD